MSDVTWWALQPSGIVIVLLVVAWLANVAGGRRLSGTIVGMVLFGWLAVVVAPIDAWLAAPLERRNPVPQTLPASVDGIVVLGGSVEWRASIERGQLSLGPSAERMIAGAALARRYPNAVLALTGVTSDALSADFRPVPEPTSMFFGEAFADRRPLVLSDAASTYEEALLSLERLQPRPGETWLLVTSAWHMPRAWATFRTLGWTTVPYPVDPMSAGARWGWPDPPGAAGRLADVDQIVREWGAVLVYRRTGRIAPEAWDASAAGTP